MPDNEEYKNQISRLRIELDQLDEKIITLLVERFTVTEKVGILKKKYQVGAIDIKREQEKFKNITKQAKRFKLSPVLLNKIFRLIIDEVVKNHRKK